MNLFSRVKKLHCVKICDIKRNGLKMKVFILLILTLNLYAINSFEFYEDKTNTLKIEDIVKLKDKFKLNKSNKVNFGLSTSTFWIKLILKNENNFFQNKFLRVSFPFIEHIDLYEIGKNIKIYKNGSGVTLENRDIKDCNIVFDIPFKQQETKELFLKVKSNTAKFIFLNLYENVKEYKYISFLEDTFNAFLLGVLTLAIIYNFFIYLYLKDRVFIIYVVFLFTQMVLLLHINGFILNFIDNLHFLLIFTVTQFFIMILMIFLIKEFFEVKTNFKTFNFIFNFFIIATFIIILIAIWDINLANRIKNPYLVPIWNIIIFMFFIKSLITKRSKITTLFIFGWFMYSLSAFYYILLVGGAVKLTFLSINSFKFGILFEAILFSILLSYKFYILKDEKIKALKENAKQEKILIQQSKMAQMGEMIGAIAHQWRQPLNALSLMIQNIKISHKRGLLDSEKLESLVTNSLKQVKFMSQTIDDFKNFFTPNRKKEDFSIQQAIEEILTILSTQLKNHNIVLLKNYNDFEINGYKNEFKQVALNIINNAKDELILKNIENPKIEIKIYSEDLRGVISIKDNANGIKEEIINKIFEPYFTTKEKSGTGIGLYMSKVIIEHMGGEIKVQNITNGVKFNIYLPIY